MDQQTQKINRPFYKKIYEEMIHKKYPDKMDYCRCYLEKEEISCIDILSLNQIISKSGYDKYNQVNKYKSYDTETIINILEFQKKNQLNNSKLSLHFNISRNSITKWKKIFLV